MKRYKLEELKALPVLSQGQTDNLHIEGEDEQGKFRVWLSRMTMEDGMPYNNQVTIERYNESTGYTWKTVEEYEAQ
jgi:hypothetical protein